MPIKESTQSGKESTDKWQGEWGSITPTAHSLLNLRIERSSDRQEKYLYPYRSIARCHWKSGDPETLEILAGRDQILINGKGLETLLQAIEGEQLEWVIETPKNLGDQSELSIYSILIERLG